MSRTQLLPRGPLGETDLEARPRSRMLLPMAAVAAVGMALALIAVAQIGSSLAVLVLPFEYMYGEATLHDLASRVVDGVPLYQPLDRPPYTIANYTPLFYWL